MVLKIYAIFVSYVNAPGYSVAVVHTEYGPLYVAGAPRHSMRGKVLVFQDNRLKQTLQGEQVLCFSHPGHSGQWGSGGQHTSCLLKQQIHFLLQTHLDLARCGLHSLWLLHNAFGTSEEIMKFGKRLGKRLAKWGVLYLCSVLMVHGERGHQLWYSFSSVKLLNNDFVNAKLVTGSVPEDGCNKINNRK